jgi:hypothetical protein
MSIKVYIGLFITTVGLSVARFGVNLMDIRKPPESDGIIYIHGVLEGPYTQSYLESEWTGPEDYEAYLLVKIEVDGVVSDTEWYFETIEESLTWVRHFKSSIEPLVIESRDTNE